VAALRGFVASPALLVPVGLKVKDVEYPALSIGCGRIGFAAVAEIDVWFINWWKHVIS
jgi:hypothetical protein